MLISKWWSHCHKRNVVLIVSQLYNWYWLCRLIIMNIDTIKSNMSSRGLVAPLTPTFTVINIKINIILADLHCKHHLGAPLTPRNNTDQGVGRSLQRHLSQICNNRYCFWLKLCQWWFRPEVLQSRPDKSPFPQLLRKSFSSWSAIGRRFIGFYFLYVLVILHICLPLLLC